MSYLAGLNTVTGSGLISLNGLNASSQTFNTGSVGSTFNIVSSGSVHTFNVPDASTTARGFINTIAQSFLGDKSFGGLILTPFDVSDKATGGTIGANTASVDLFSTLRLLQTTNGQALTIPNPTNTVAGRLLFVTHDGTATGTTIAGVAIAPAKSVFFMWDGSSWNNLADGGGGGATSPAGSNTQVQYNNNGVFGASPNFVFNSTTESLGIGIPTITGIKLAANGNAWINNTLQMGNTQAAPYGYIAAGLNGFDIVANTNTNGMIIFNTNGAEQARFRNGNLGLGTNNPQAKLHVIGNIIAEGPSMFFGSNTNTFAENVLNAVAGSNRLFKIRTAGVDRWSFGTDSSPESGSNAGGNFEIYRYADDGAFLGSIFTISRRLGAVGIANSLPSARLHLGAGTALANTASLKLDPGVLLTTPENGAVEYNGNDAWITIAGVRTRLNNKVDSLTTIGSAGAATLTSGVLNIPNYVGGAGASPLTTKGDLFTYSTLDTRLPVGTNGQILSADSTAATGLKWIAAASGSPNTFVDQTPDNGAYRLLSGAVNGSNTVFTVFDASYVTGTLIVALNGVIQAQGAGDDYRETSPAAGTFTFNTAPQTGDVITAQYQITVSVATGVATTSIEVDFGNVGTAGVKSKRFTITDAGISPTSKILAYGDSKPATGRVGNDYEWDSINYTANAGTGNFILTAYASGKIIGKRKLFYSSA